MSNKIKFIYFDLDDTILDHGHAERSALSATVAEYPDAFQDLSVPDILHEYHEINVVLWRDYSRGNITRPDLQRERFQRLIDRFGVKGVEPLELGDTYLSHYPKHWMYCKGADTVFHALADRYPVGIITNGFEKTQRKKLNAFPEMRDRLAATVISETVGYLKPDLRLFAHAEEAARVSGDEILYVGDSFESDIEGASRAGWHSAWYRMGRPGDHTLASIVFDDWEEFDIDAL